MNLTDKELLCIIDLIHRTKIKPFGIKKRIELLELVLKMEKYLDNKLQKSIENE